MKINRPGSDLKKTEQISQKDSDKAVVKTSGSRFAGFMDKAEGDNFEVKIRKLAEDIIAQGEKLTKRVDVGELKLYKSMIAEFLNEIINNTHKYNKMSKLDRRGRYKVFVTVKKINEELDLLTTDVLNNEKENIKVLKRIEDIRGMILDIEI